MVEKKNFKSWSKFLRYDEKHQLRYSRNSMISKQINTKKITPRLIMVKLLKPNDKEIILRAANEKCHIPEENAINDSWSLSKTMQTNIQ